MNWSFLFSLAATLCACLTHVGAKPNVIVIMTDDQAYGDLSCHGNPVIETPNIDKLYEQSVRFTDFHVDPTCSPTRGALLTGKYSHRAGVWHTVSGGNHLRASETTMANIFKSAGYRTGCFGKWHLGSNYPYRPMDRGFDEWLGNGDGGTGTTDDWFDNDRVNDRYLHNGEWVDRKGFGPDVFFDAAIDYIKRDDQPFFIYLANYLPHDPHTLPDPRWIEKYGDEASNYEAFYFAGIERIDWNIGRLIEALEESGKTENTIVIFLTDNGGFAGLRIHDAGMRGQKAQAYEGGHRVPFFISWPDGELKYGTDVSDLTAHIDVLPTLMELCGIPNEAAIDFDGRSFKEQLFQPELKLPARTLFVENQRTYLPQPWFQTAGMTNRWRLVNNKELYDMSTDPGQHENVIEQYPEVVEAIRKAHKVYWARVTPNDRVPPRFIIGHPNDPESLLTCSDWYLEKEPPWNHGLVGAGISASGVWQVNIHQDGIYRFEVSRWPREAMAAIRGTPTFNKAVDSYDHVGGLDQFIYRKEIKAVPVEKIELRIGDAKFTKTVQAKDTLISFELPLKAGATEIQSLMLNNSGELISGAYYVYVRQK